jgi:phage baseplate assembly protein W
MTEVRAMSCLEDLDPDGRVVTGVEAIRQAAYRRLVCPPGGEFYAPTYGLGLSGFVNRNLPASMIRGMIASQLAREERIDSSLVDVSEQSDGSILISITAQTAEGPFTLTLDVSSVTVEVLPSVPYGQ